ncbi:hypothetical protein CSUB01_03455 [Colletotrichum sublineola]|uniref:Uncharacterized protein n=1 Tax=Colletotrichum sublineola TaxID=1173701 RepID=A0A066XWB9_COLSU|nr:hypothetical protein CSUB01_03455 [Colletotrichum sublineola]
MTDSETATLRSSRASVTPASLRIGAPSRSSTPISSPKHFNQWVLGQEVSTESTIDRFHAQPPLFLYRLYVDKEWLDPVAQFGDANKIAKLFLSLLPPVVLVIIDCSWIPDNSGDYGTNNDADDEAGDEDDYPLIDGNDRKHVEWMHYNALHVLDPSVFLSDSRPADFLSPQSGCPEGRLALWRRSATTGSWPSSPGLSAFASVEMSALDHPLGTTLAVFLPAFEKWQPEVGVLGKPSAMARSPTFDRVSAAERCSRYEQLAKQSKFLNARVL